MRAGLRCGTPLGDGGPAHRLQPRRMDVFPETEIATVGVSQKAVTSGEAGDALVVKAAAGPPNAGEKMRVHATVSSIAVRPKEQRDGDSAGVVSRPRASEADPVLYDGRETGN